MSVTAVVGCWCLASCFLAPVIGRAIRCSRADALRAEVARRGRPKQIRVA